MPARYVAVLGKKLDKVYKKVAPFYNVENEVTS